MKLRREEVMRQFPRNVECQVQNYSSLLINVLMKIHTKV